MNSELEELFHDLKPETIAVIVARFDRMIETISRPDSETLDAIANILLAIGGKKVGTAKMNRLYKAAGR